MWIKILGQYHKKVAIIDENMDIYSYLNIQQFVQDFSEYIEKSNLAFCLCSNSIESLMGYLAFMDKRAVPLMIDESIDQSLLHSLIRLYKPRYIWGNSKIIESLLLDEAHKLTNYKSYDLIELNTHAVKLDSSLRFLLTTSGSTGSPKLVKLTQENVLSNAESIAEYLNINENERAITLLPMHYSFGLSIIHSHLLKGATILLTSKSIMSKELWQFIKDQKATSISGVPYTFEILKKLRFMRMDLPHLKTITQAGGKLNLDLNREFATWAMLNNKYFYVMYGQTEATARMSYLPPEYSLTKLGSMGIAIPRGKFSLVDDQRNLITENNTVGELVYEGPNVSLGYAENLNDLAKEDENKGILYTGDLAKRDEDGFYYIVGRKKRFIKIYGNRVNLDETERLLKNKVQECACTGKDDKLIIYITDVSLLEEIKKYISSLTKINHTAIETRYIESIPKNSSGKTIYAQLSAE